MPYDPRKISNGGNRGIDTIFTRHAPKGKFRVVGVDTFDGTDFHEGDFNSLPQARRRARKKGGEMTVMHIYDDHGDHKGKFGEF